MSAGTSIRAEVQSLASGVKGFLSPTEGMRLFDLACTASRLAPCVEIGSYCGKSALFLGEGCRVAGRAVLFAVDHHRGSEEQQPGQEYFDPDLFDPRSERVDTLPQFRRNVASAGLEEWVIAIVGRSTQVARNWPGARLGLVFIDGGHSQADVDADYEAWWPRIVSGGFLCFHDVYPDPAHGGQAPYRTFLEAQRARARWRTIGLFESLGILQRR